MANRTSIKQTSATEEAQTQKDQMTEANRLSEDILVELKVVSLLLNEAFGLKEDLDALRMGYK